MGDGSGKSKPQVYSCVTQASTTGSEFKEKCMRGQVALSQTCWKMRDEVGMKRSQIQQDWENSPVRDYCITEWNFFWIHISAQTGSKWVISFHKNVSAGFQVLIRRDTPHSQVFRSITLNWILATKHTATEDAIQQHHTAAMQWFGQFLEKHYN